jgi:hypothetical protein
VSPFVPLRNHPYGIAVAVYVMIVLAVGIVSSICGVGHRDYLATRELVVNHRIVSADFRRPDTFTSRLGFYLPAVTAIEGKYVRRKIDVNDPLGAASLGDGPDLNPGAGRQALVVPLATGSHLIGLLDVGRSVGVTGQDDDKGAVSFEATVHAIQCEPKKGDAPTCRVILSLPSDRRLKLPTDLAGLRLTPRTPPAAADRNALAQEVSMAEPIWRKIAEVRVPEGIGKGDAKAQWTLALELVPSGKLLKLEVIADQETPNSGTWKPKGLTDRVTADGDFKKCDKSVAQLLKTAPCGALIARIGGSATDQPTFNDQGAVSPASTTVFSVGRTCIFSVPATPTGSLFLGANVAPSDMADIEGDLVVRISEAI